MKLATAHEHARNAKTSKQASTLYNNIEHELALGDYSEDDAETGERALAHLEEHFPGVKHAARNIEMAPALSRSANKRVGEGERREGERRESRAPRSAPPASPRRRASRARGSVAGRAVRSGYDTAADSSWGDLIGQFILGGVGLSIGYLLLTRAAGAGKLFEGATTVVRGVVSPKVDPLNPKGAL